MPRTKAKVQTVTNTQLGVAVLAAFMAGGLAFAAAPGQMRIAAAPKCGVNSSKVVSVIQGCARGQYSGVDYTCHDGTKGQHRPGVCTSPAELNAFVRNACANKCNGAPVQQNPVLSIDIDNDYAGLREDRYALAGTDRFLAGRVRLNAVREDMNLRDLALEFRANSAFTALRDMENSIDRVSLYSSPNLADASLLGMTEYASSTVVIEDVDYQIRQGEPAYLYIALDLNSVGVDIDGTAVPKTAFQITALGRGTQVQSMVTNNEIVPHIGNTRTNDITITPVKITDVRSDFPGGVLVGGQQNIFSFEVTADAGRNTDIFFGNPLQAHLHQVQLQLATDVGTNLTPNVSALMLCRNDSGNCIDLRTSGVLSATTTIVNLVNARNGTSSVNMSAFLSNNDQLVDDGETVEFTVKGTFQNVTDHFAQVRLVNLNNGGMNYGIDTEAIGIDNYVFTDVRLDAPRAVDYPQVIGRALVN